MEQKNEVKKNIIIIRKEIEQVCKYLETTLIPAGIVKLM